MCIKFTLWVHTPVVTSLNSEWDLRSMHWGRPYLCMGYMPYSSPTCTVPLTGISEPKENKPVSASPTLPARQLHLTHTQTHTRTRARTCLQPPTPKHTHTLKGLQKAFLKHALDVHTESPYMGRDCPVARLEQFLNVLSFLFALPPPFLP